MLAKLKNKWHASLAKLDYRWNCSRLRLSLARLRTPFAGVPGSPLWSLGVQDGLKRINDHCRREGCFSWTSAQYQQDLVQFVLDNRATGRGIIEVGCFRGGLSAQLAFIAQQLGWPFYAMDIDATAVAATGQLLQTLGLDRHSVVFEGALDRFAKITPLHERPVLIVIDGDHRFDAVRHDIDYVYQLNRLPHAAAFHDFSLRHLDFDERSGRSYLLEIRHENVHIENRYHRLRRWQLSNPQGPVRGRTLLERKWL